MMSSKEVLFPKMYSAVGSYSSGAMNYVSPQLWGILRREPLLVDIGFGGSDISWPITYITKYVHRSSNNTPGKTVSQRRPVFSQIRDA